MLLMSFISRKSHAKSNDFPILAPIIFFIITAITSNSAFATEKIAFESSLKALPAGEDLILVYTPEKTPERVEASYRVLPFGKWEDLEVEQQEDKKKWHIKVEAIHVSTQIEFQVKAFYTISGNELDEARQKLSTIFIDLIDRTIDIAFPTKEILKKSEAFKEGVKRLENYRWQKKEGKPFLTSEIFLADYFMENMDKLRSSYIASKERFSEIKGRINEIYEKFYNEPGDWFCKLFLNTDDKKDIWEKEFGIDDIDKIKNKLWDTFRSSLNSTMLKVHSLDFETMVTDPGAFLKSLREIKENKRSLSALLKKLENKAKLDEYPREFKSFKNRYDQLVKKVENFKEEIDKATERLKEVEKVQKASVFSNRGEINDYDYYFGIDTSVIAINSVNEIQGFFNIAIYLDKQPNNLEPVPFGEIFKRTMEWIRTRITPMFGIGTSIFGESELPDQNFFLGLGFRINKYTRLIIGKVIYESIDEDAKSLKSPWAFGISFDARAFVSLKNR